MDGNLLRKLVATVGIALDVSAALVITVPLIREPQAERDRKAQALGFAESPNVRFSQPGQTEASTSHHRTLLGLDRRRAIISTSLVVAGVLCSFAAVWLP